LRSKRWTDYGGCVDKDVILRVPAGTVDDDLCELLAALGEQLKVFAGHRCEIGWILTHLLSSDQVGRRPGEAVVLLAEPM
jgi:hypothetical protein